MMERMKKQIDFFVEVDKMKGILRQTLLADKSRRENDAEHSWHFALMAMMLFEYADDPDIDLYRVIKMALVHDLVEIYAGDTFAYDTSGYESKGERENASADKLFSLLPVDQALEIRQLWEEFEAMETPDSIYASAIDRLQPFISNYVTDGYTWKKHHVTRDMVYKRMLPIKTAAPKIWEFIEDVITDSIKKGYLRE